MRKFRAAALAVATAAAIGVSVPAVASASPVRVTVPYAGNLCVVSQTLSHGVGWCLSDRYDSRRDGQVMQMSARNSAGEPVNDWSAVLVGHVSLTWPWAAGLRGPGAPATWDSILRGRDVVLLNASPYGHRSNYCAYADFSAQSESGYVRGYNGCNVTARNQMWVIFGDYYINVRATNDATNAGAVGAIVMTGDFRLSPVTLRPSGPYGSQQFRWYPRY